MYQTGASVLLSALQAGVKTVLLILKCNMVAKNHNCSSGMKTCMICEGNNHSSTHTHTRSTAASSHAAWNNHKGLPRLGCI